jgi:hypothetical protein
MTDKLMKCPHCQRKTETIWAVRIWWSADPSDVLMCPGDVASLRMVGYRVILEADAA